MRLRLTLLRNPVLLLGAVLGTLFILCGPATGDSTSYPSTLYLGGVSSSSLTGAYQLQTSRTGVSANVPGVSPYVLPAPTAVVCGACGAGNLTSSGSNYQYRYTEVDANGETAPSVAATAPAVTGGQITVGGLPTGVTVRLYRQKGTLNPPWSLVTTLTNNSSSTYNDNIADGSLGAILPEAQNRTNTSQTGWFEYAPGAPLTTTAINGAAVAFGSVTSPAFDGKGWVVDGAGNVAFPEGNWTFKVKITSAGSTLSVGRLAIGMWIESGGSAVGSPLIDPACGTGNVCGVNSVANISLGSQTTSPISTTFSNVPAFALTSGQHLFVEFFRDQTTGSTSNTISTLDDYDGFAGITLHPTTWNFPNTPTPVTPTAGLDTNSDALTASFSGDAGDTGSITFNVCSDSACSHVVTSGTSSTVTSGQNASWTPSSLADGTYWWEAQATDAATGQSGWSSTQSFTYDTTPPDTTIGTGPANPTNSTSATFSFSSSEAGSSFQCQLDGGGYSSCVSPKSYNALADDSHTFKVEATDPAGNTDATPASSTWTVDTLAPGATITAGPANLTNARNASFSFSSSKTGSTFQCKLDSGSYNACTSPTVYSGLADGSHTFQVEATDTAGNTGSASSSWTVDTAAPDTSITAGPASPTNATSATFSFSSSKTGSSFQCQLDGGGYSSCASPKSYNALADGSHTFQVEATDPAGNTDATPASSTWTVDTVAPDTTITAGPASPTNATSATFSFGADKAGSSYQCSLDGGGYSSCASPQTYSGLADGSHTFQVEATDPAGNMGSASSTWTVDTTPPGAPGSLTGSAGADGLTLKWTAPAGEPIAQYVLYANGVSTTRIDGGTTTTTVGDFIAGDTRTFTVAAVDAAGNEGPRSVTLTAVPDLVGLQLSEANAALQARGFVIGKQTLGASDSGALVVSQQPTAGTLAPVQSTVLVAFGASSASSGSGARSTGSGAVSGPVAPLAVHISGARTVSCTQSSQLALHIQLDRKANVAVRFLTAAGVSLGSMKLVPVHAGSRTLNLHLPFVLSKGKSYRVIVTASIRGQIVQDEIKLTIVRKDVRTTASVRTCG